MDDIIDCPSPNFDERDQPVSIVVLHYTGMSDAASAIDRLRDPEARVSCHYLIAEDGQVLRMVPEDKRAWHAGRSYWRGMHDVNGASVGIEIVNPGHELGYRPFTRPQMDSLLPLLAGIVRRHQVPRANVVGHSDVAPARKQDPGELFDWGLLARHGLAVARPARDLVDPHWTDGGFLLALERYGYDVREAEAAVTAFQRRFRPELVDGETDGECRAILLQLLLDRERGHIL
ncbi:N-acetylmuramoyl-L-alanine amidase [Sphingosinicella sp. CPCC 101087]|uniref:N-acetylmuramoyl-L-alanine amidase n=1 Tax=Sphingosinicella sp. CPCC 101087 TaxID=2497754 RepID=UPI00101DFD37|nr:N-acetylmuramoyl-L-alanine amidase [Sphingosinicella sp. CPCC 101087]